MSPATKIVWCTSSCRNVSTRSASGQESTRARHRVVEPAQRAVERGGAHVGVVALARELGRERVRRAPSRSSRGTRRWPVIGNHQESGLDLVRRRRRHHVHEPALTLADQVSVACRARESERLSERERAAQARVAAAARAGSSVAISSGVMRLAREQEPCLAHAQARAGTRGASRRATRREEPNRSAKTSRAERIRGLPDRGAAGRARAAARRAVIARHARRRGARGGDARVLRGPTALACRTCAALADPERRISVSGPEPVPDADWEREWRSGLAPRRVAGALDPAELLRERGRAGARDRPAAGLRLGRARLDAARARAPARGAAPGRDGARRGHGQRHPRARGPARRRRTRARLRHRSDRDRERGREPRAEPPAALALLRRDRGAREGRALRRGRRESAPARARALPAGARLPDAPRARALGSARARARRSSTPRSSTWTGAANAR